MKSQKSKRLIIWAIILVLVGSSLWYMRPMNVYDMNPGLDPEIISISMIRNGGGADITDRNLRFEKGDESFEQMLNEITSLKFCRLPTNLLLQLFPPLADLGSRTVVIQDHEYHIGIGLANSGSEIWDANLQYNLGQWNYRDYTHTVSLPLLPVQHDGKEFGDRLWAYADNK